MNNQLITYYIPTNPNIQKGHIYTLYLNNTANLDLTQILSNQPITLNNLTQSIPTPITISQNDYTRLLELNNLSHQLSEKRTKSIQTFIEEETKTTTELTKINTERQQLIKKLTKGKEVTK